MKNNTMKGYVLKTRLLEYHDSGIDIFLEDGSFETIEKSPHTETSSPTQSQLKCIPQFKEFLGTSHMHFR
jgi:hypothetical protein